MKRIVILFFILFACSCGKQSGVRIWPQFRGVNGSGVASENAKPPDYFEKRNQDWKIDLPSGVSSPVIWDNKLFITAYFEDKKELQIICINRKNGRLIWKNSVIPDTIERCHSLGSPAQSTLVTDGERVISYFGSCGFICYDMEGKEMWRYPMTCDPGYYGNAASPVIAGNKVILIDDVRSDKCLFALEKSTGNKLWKTSFQDNGLPSVGGVATPVIHNDLIIVHRSGEVAAYLISDGSFKWGYRLLATGFSTPVIADNKVIAACWYNSTDKENREKLPEFQELLQNNDSDKNRKISKDEFPSDLKLFYRTEIEGIEGSVNYVKDAFWAFDSNSDDEIDSQEWIAGNEMLKSIFYKESGLLAIDPNSEGQLTDSNLLWRVPDNVPEVPSPIFYMGRIYMIKDGGILTCVNPETGKVMYKTRIGNPGSYLASPIAANGLIYIFSYNGRLKILRAGDEYKVLAEHNFKDNIAATPAIVGNNIYIRTRTGLMAFSD